MSIPTSTTGVFQIDNKSHSVKTIPIPEIPASLLLVKVKTIAVNPVDYKYPDYGLAKPGSGVGCDFAGEVVAVGSDVKGFSPGDAVFASQPAYYFPDNNLAGTAFSEYVFTIPELSIRAKLNDVKAEKGTVLGQGEGSVIDTFEKAAAVPLASLTAALSLSYHFNNKIKFDADAGKILSTEPDAGSKNILIWGGATSVGQYAIQIASQAGYKVITTASSKHSTYLKKLGASHVFDYNSPSVVEDIKKVGPLVHVFDTVSGPSSWPLAYQSIGTDVSENVNIVATLPFEHYDVGQKNPRVNFEHVNIFKAAIYVLSNKNGSADDEQNYEISKAFYAVVSKLISENKFLGNPIKIYEESGVAAAEKAIDVLQSANASGYKFIVDI